MDGVGNLKFEAYKTSGELFDSFFLKKKSSKKKNNAA